MSRIDIQWRDTDACMHLVCDRCLDETHIDTPGIDQVVCEGCGQVYDLPDEIDVGE